MMVSIHASDAPVPATIWTNPQTGRVIVDLLDKHGPVPVCVHFDSEAELLSWVVRIVKALTSDASGD